MADTWLERTGEKVDWLLSQGVGPFWHFNGVERAAPPMMGPRQWEHWVVPYDGELMRRIKDADPEARIHVHCHGKVRTLLIEALGYRFGALAGLDLEMPGRGVGEVYEALRNDPELDALKICIVTGRPEQVPKLIAVLPEVALPVSDRIVSRLLREPTDDRIKSICLRILANPRDLTKIFQTPEYAAWRSLRESEDSRYIGLAMPRFQIRS